MSQTGKLDDLITLMSLTEVNDRGSLSQSYASVGNVWAEIISQKGGEAFEAARINARQIIRIRIRYRDDIDLKWRVRWDDQDYNITAIDRTERRQGNLWMTCQVVGAL